MKVESANHAPDFFFGLVSDFSGWLTGGVIQCQLMSKNVLTESCSGLVAGYSGWFRADWITENFNPIIDGKF